MTKHVIKKSISLTLAILIAAIAIAIPLLSARTSAEDSVRDSSGMEQNRSRAPSTTEFVYLDLPEGLLDLENNQIGRGIDQQHLDIEEQSDNNIQQTTQSYPNENVNALPSDSPLNAARNEGDENAKHILKNEMLWNLINNSEEAEKYYDNLYKQENAKNNPEPATSVTTAPTVPATTAATQPSTTKAPATTTAATTAATTAKPETTAAPTTAAPATEAPAPPPAASGKFLLSISNPNPNYVGRPVQVQDRAVLEGLVMGEFGNDYTGAVLVAQAIRDTMTLTGVYNTGQIARQWGYTGRIHSNVSDAVKRAVAFVFDQGGSAVQHSIYYFYASHLIYSSWHETQKFVVQYGGCRFFSRW